MRLLVWWGGVLAHTYVLSTASPGDRVPGWFWWGSLVTWCLGGLFGGLWTLSKQLLRGRGVGVLRPARPAPRPTEEKIGGTD